jgi:hypothetical protein
MFPASREGKISIEEFPESGESFALAATTAGTKADQPEAHRHVICLDVFLQKC